jgi:hypothetical protein
MKRILFASCLLFFWPHGVSAHTVAEVVKSPAAFDQQSISVFGEVTNMVTRYGDAPYTAFDLRDADGVALPVFLSGKPAFAQGDLCHVTGTFVQEKNLGSYVLVRGVEAEKVEKVSEAEYKTQGPLFRKKQKVHGRSEGKYPRGLYFPQ